MVVSKEEKRATTYLIDIVYEKDPTGSSSSLCSTAAITDSPRSKKWLNASIRFRISSTVPFQDRMVQQQRQQQAERLRLEP